ncbi:Os10g0521550 [Oryza sativa Japonica Group]|uniref:Os10g0521550 protein n=1 Tax=Oryza sativa subsp. japonica TaxID=39947 RepID=A0A0P0XWX5_ORYSJ|nr:Os10g0521550 [Oryza sativa Japonica Group]
MYLKEAQAAWQPREEQMRWNLGPSWSASARSWMSIAALLSDLLGSGSLSPYPARSNATMYTPNSFSNACEARGESMRPPEKPCE